MASYTHGRDIAIPEKSVFRLISRAGFSETDLMVTAEILYVIRKVRETPPCAQFGDKVHLRTHWRLEWEP